MNQFDFDQTSAAFRSLSDPLRLRIYRLVLRAPGICICNLAAICQQRQYNISRAARELILAGMVKQRKAGRWLHLEPAQLPDPVSFLCLVEEWPLDLFEEDEKGLADYLKSFRDSSQNSCMIRTGPRLARINQNTSNNSSDRRGTQA
ncbi:MAG: hypothetical protein WCP58_08530 [bacterium]